MSKRPFDLIYKKRPVEDRFWNKVAITPSCWLWTGATAGDGYGAFRIGDKLMIAHRVVYEMLIGKIPEGLQIDHLCRIKKCVNPNHLEAITQQENLLRGDTLAAKKSKQTHCIHGHEFTKENTYRRPTTLTRSCKTCKREHYKAKKRYKLKIL